MGNNKVVHILEQTIVQIRQKHIAVCNVGGTQFNKQCNVKSMVYSRTPPKCIYLNLDSLKDGLVASWSALCDHWGILVSPLRKTMAGKPNF